MIGGSEMTMWLYFIGSLLAAFLVGYIVAFIMDEMKDGY